MCLTRKTIYNNGHRFYKNHYQPYVLNIPCGQCTECRQQKSNEWRARTYYQFIDTITKGGYIIWDRLSYTDENVPHIKQLENNVPDKLDFVCFNREDTTNFMKRLRENLHNEKVNVEGNLKYMIAAEYGQEEDTYISDIGKPREGTLRPHYHAIFYCTANLEPAKLSMHIKKAWGKGTTNGIEDNPTYFTHKGKIDCEAKALKIADYIGKYCMKNQDFDKVVKYKTKELIKYYIECETRIQEDEKLEKELRKKANRDRLNRLLRKVKTYHVQSEGYGKYALDCNDAIMDGTLLGMPDQKKVRWWQKLPMYYIRKMYYNYHKTPEGKIIWYLTETGKQWKLKNIDKTIDHYAKQCENTWRELCDPNFTDIIQKYINENKLDYSATEERRRLIDLTFCYLHSGEQPRNWKHFAEYIIFHKGRISNGSIYRPDETIIINQKAALTAEYSTEPLYYNYVHQTDKDNLGRKFISLYDHGDKWRGYKHQTYQTDLKPQQFAAMCCINENSDEHFQDFDKLLDLMDQINTYKEWTKAEATRIKESVELTYKGQKKTLYKNIIQHG